MYSSFSSAPPATAAPAASAGTVSNVGGVMAIGGALMSAMGAYYGAQSQKRAMEYQAMVAESNARLAEKAAQSTLLQGQQQQNRVQLQTGALKGAQRASMAANGIDLGEGTAAQIQVQTDVMGKADADMVAQNALRAAWGYRTQGTNYSNQALMDTAGANSTSAAASAAGSLLTSGGRVASNWYSQKKAGVE